MTGPGLENYRTLTDVRGQQRLLKLTAAVLLEMQVVAQFGFSPPPLAMEGRGEEVLNFQLFTPHPDLFHEPRFQRDAGGASVQASFTVSGNDRPHPNLL